MSKELERKKDKNPYKHIRRKTKTDWYLYWLWEDPDFQAALKELNELSIYHFTKESGEGWFHEQDDKRRELRESTLSKFCITKSEFEKLITGYHRYESFDFPFTYIDTKRDKEEVHVAIPHSITRAEYMEAWDEVRDLLDGELVPFIMKKENPKPLRNRSNENTQIIYAIFKARKKDLTFREIYIKYQNQELESYDKPGNQFTSQDSLERYYNKYKPDR